MNFQDIYKPISKQLSAVELELQNISKTLGPESTQEIFEHFFKAPGKFLRPTLVLLSAGSINDNLSPELNDKLIQLAIAIELIHSASLVHDDIIDGDLLRRGQKTVDRAYGRKIAVLTGDALYSRAYFIFSKLIPRELQMIIGDITERMSLTEIVQARFANPTREEYLEVIKGKTAIFMSACCQLGASLVGATEEEANNLAEYGLNLGMAYQVIDDYTDGDPNAVGNVTLEDAKAYASKALDSISTLKESAYKDNLANFVYYLLKLSKAEAKNS